MTMKVHFIAAGGPLIHTLAGNPELPAAKKLKLNIFPLPEDISDRTSDKLRIVVAGSHGKTTVAAMIMHVFKYNNIPFDYLAGSTIDGDERLGDLSSDSRKAVTEVDKSLTPSIDPGPEFHFYKPHIAVINGINRIT